MRRGAKRRAGRAVLALLAGLVAGAWVGGGLVWVFNRTKIREAAGEVAPVSLPAADEFDLIPADAAGFAHVRAADLWKTDALAEYRRVVGKAGDDALKALDEGFVPAPSTLDRVTVVALSKPGAPKGPPIIGITPPKGKGGFQQPPPLPVDNRPDLDVVGILTFSVPFDPVKVREANLPKAVKFIAGEAEVWGDESSGTAIASRGDRTLIVGSSEAVRAFLSRPKAADGPLAPALKLAAGGTRHVVGGWNLKGHRPPPDFTRGLPPETSAVLRADALAVGVVVGRGMRFDLRAAYKDAAAAEAAEADLRKSAEAGRKSLGEMKTKMQEAVTGRPGGPKPRPAADLPGALGGLFALGAIGMLDEWLANPPLERAGSELSAAVTVESVGGAYAATAALSAGFMLPAVQKVREAAGRVQEQNNLKQLAIAMHAHHDVTGKFPAAAITNPPNSPRGRPMLSWRVAILPYLEQGALYQQFKQNEPWDSPHNIKLLPQMPKVYASPRAVAPPGKTHYQVFLTPDNAGVRTMFGRTTGRSLAAIQDGTSNTLMIVEAAEPVEWTKPQDIDYDPDGELPRLGLPGATGFQAAMGDGSVRFLPATIRPNVLHALIGGDDGDPVQIP